MAPPAAEHRGADPPPHGSTRSHPRGHGADSGNAKPRQRGPARQERAEYVNGAEAARPFPCPGRPAPSATEEGASLAPNQASSSLIREVFGALAIDEAKWAYPFTSYCLLRWSPI